MADKHLLLIWEPTWVNELHNRFYGYFRVLSYFSITRTITDNPICTIDYQIFTRDVIDGYSLFPLSMWINIITEQKECLDWNECYDCCYKYICVCEWRIVYRKTVLILDRDIENVTALVDFCVIWNQWRIYYCITPMKKEMR